MPKMSRDLGRLARGLYINVREGGFRNVSHFLGDVVINEDGTWSVSEKAAKFAFREAIDEEKKDDDTANDQDEENSEGGLDRFNQTDDDREVSGKDDDRKYNENADDREDNGNDDGSKDNGNDDGSENNGNGDDNQLCAKSREEEEIGGDEVDASDDMDDDGADDDEVFFEALEDTSDMNNGQGQVSEQDTSCGGKGDEFRKDEDMPGKTQATNGKAAMAEGNKIEVIKQFSVKGTYLEVEMVESSTLSGSSASDGSDSDGIRPVSDSKEKRVALMEWIQNHPAGMSIEPQR
ncbi:hypothetical protein BG004_004372 [Podila humilis]|nr:hypothetical protein BG004_004372 [Podila humilis]